MLVDFIMSLIFIPILLLSQLLAVPEMYFGMYCVLLLLLTTIPSLRPFLSLPLFPLLVLLKRLPRRQRQRLPALLPRVPPPLLALLLLRLALAQLPCTDLSAPLYERERCVRESILRPGATSAPFYDKHVSPTVEYRRPVNVSLLLQVWQINELSVQDSQMELAAWTTFEWVDERLAFNATESGVVATTAFASLDPEHSEIWVPPVYLLNRESAQSGLQASATKDAVIFPSGLVSWRNQHNLGLLCTFYGLKAIPFDKLTGQLMFGTWTRPDSVVNLTFAPRGAPGREGLVFGFDDELEPNTFREYSIKMDECETYTDTIVDKNLGIQYPVLWYVRASGCEQRAGASERVRASGCERSEHKDDARLRRKRATGGVGGG
jgi:hypothetical protein